MMEKEKLVERMPDYDYSYKVDFYKEGMSQQVEENVELEKLKYRNALLQNNGVQVEENSLLREVIKEGRKFAIVKEEGDLDHRNYPSTPVRGGVVNSVKDIQAEKGDRALAIFNVTKGRIMDLTWKHNFEEKYGHRYFIYFTGGHFVLVSGNKPILKIPKKKDGIEQFRDILKKYYDHISVNYGDHLIFQERKKLNHLQFYQFRPFWFELFDESIV